MISGKLEITYNLTELRPESDVSLRVLEIIARLLSVRKFVSYAPMSPRQARRDLISS